MKTISQPRELAYNIAVLNPKEKFRSAPGVNPLGCSLHILTSGLFLAFLLCPSVVAEEPGGNPDGHTPETGEVAIPLPTNSATTPPTAKSTSEPDATSNVRSLAAEFLKYPAVASCSKKDCTILVTDFVLPDGNTSPYGMQLADELSEELATQNHKIRVVDRSLLQAFLAEYLIPAQSVNAGLVRSIAFALKARFVVLGTTNRSDDEIVQLSTRLFDVADKNGSGYSAVVVVNLLAPKSSVDLSPSKPFAPLPSTTSTAGGESIYRSGVDGVSNPNCTYMPNPRSEEVRKFQLSGVILIDAVINSEGKFENVRIIRGLPDGLNDATLATMKTWRCNPALKDGKPVPTRVQFEVHFEFRPN